MLWWQECFTEVQRCQSRDIHFIWNVCNIPVARALQIVRIEYFWFMMKLDRSVVFLQEQDDDVNGWLFCVWLSVYLQAGDTDTWKETAFQRAKLLQQVKNPSVVSTMPYFDFRFYPALFGRTVHPTCDRWMQHISKETSACLVSHKHTLTAWLLHCGIALYWTALMFCNLWNFQGWLYTLKSRNLLCSQATFLLVHLFLNHLIS